MNLFTHEDEKPRPTVESIMRQQKIRRVVTRIILIFILIIICVFIGWFIGTIGQKSPQASLDRTDNTTPNYVVT